MAFKDCLDKALFQGMINQEQYEKAMARLDEAMITHKGDREKVRDTVSAAFLADAAEKVRIKKLDMEKITRLKTDMFEFKDVKGKSDIFEAFMRKINHFGYTGFESYNGRQQALLSMAQRTMGSIMDEFQRNLVTGFHHKKAMVGEMVDEILGKDTGNETAKGLAQAFTKTNEMLVDRWNAAGGSIEKLPNYFPQSHDVVAIMKLSKNPAERFEKWRTFVFDKLDYSKMRDPYTQKPLVDAASGGALTPEQTTRINQFLKKAFENIITSGDLTKTPNRNGLGSEPLIKSRSMERQLIFKDADSFKAYHEQFGAGDLLKAMFDHTVQFTKDIAAVEIFGSNPRGTLKWMTAAIESEYAKAITGKPSLFNLEGNILGIFSNSERKKMEMGAKAAHRLEQYFIYEMGMEEIVGPRKIKLFADVRNVLSSAYLGAAIIPSMFQDPVNDTLGRRAIGMKASANTRVWVDTIAQGLDALPITRFAGEWLNRLNGEPRDVALRHGLMLEHFKEIMGREAAHRGLIEGSRWSNYLADMTQRLSGLEPFTTARRAIFRLDFIHEIAGHLDKDFNALPERLRKIMAGYDITAGDWNGMRKLPVTKEWRKNGFVAPEDVFNYDQEAGARYIAMIVGETERVVPTRNSRANSILGIGKRGTWISEPVNSMMQFKSYGLSHMMLQLERLHEEGAQGRGRGAAYAASLVIPSTIMLMLGVQIQQIVNGKDPQSMNPSTKEGLGLMGSAFLRSGGLGVFGDFIQSATSNNGQSWGTMLQGPAIGLVSDVSKATLGNIGKIGQGNTTFARDTVMLAGRNTPMLSSHWATRLAWRRLIVDNLHAQLDPRAYQRFIHEERRAMRERGQQFWWRPGETSPRRGPNFSAAFP